MLDVYIVIIDINVDENRLVSSPNQSINRVRARNIRYSNVGTFWDGAS
jgi:hypothetical protein